MCPVCRMLQDVEQAIRSAIKTSVPSSWHFISTYRRFFMVVLCILILSKSFLFSRTNALYICLGVH